MRFSFIQGFILLSTFSIAKAGEITAQEILNRPVSLDLDRVSLKKAMTAIEKEANVYFTYRPEVVDNHKKVSVHANEKRLEDVLDEVFAPLHIQYKVFSNQNIVLSAMPVKTDGTGLAEPVQPIEIESVATLRGVVTDAANGEPLIGANVLVKGTSVGTTTDVDGSFSLTTTQEPPLTLVISYTGYASREVVVTDAAQPVNVALETGATLEEVTVIGSRGKPRTDVDRPVPVDVFNVKELSSTGQIDLGQSLQYSAPSFNASRFGINDLAPFVDPATLRGLGPDQTLMLVNGKRRHKVAFFSLNDGLGKGQLGNDINSIPTLAVKRVEILRDGAAAQYGSDAIAGVMNMELNNARSGGSMRFFTGTGISDPKWDGIGNKGANEGESIYGGTVYDGETYVGSLNFGLPWGEKGFINTTLHTHHNEAYDRSGFYNHSRGWYTNDKAEDERLRKIFGIDLDRAVLGAAENTNGGVFINAGRPIDDNWSFYGFGGFTKKEVITGVFSRPPAQSSRAVLEVFPNGYNPKAPGILTDFQVVSGAKGELANDLSLDISAGYSGNKMELFATNTVNPSLGAASPNRFFTGALAVSQTVFNADLSKSFGKTSLSVGTEVRFEDYEQTMGQTEAWQIGPLATKTVEILDSLGNVIGTEVEGFKDIGASGREGLSDRTEGRWRRSNVGAYLELESDITDNFLVGGAIRLENYSDFGSDFSYKLATRYRVADALSVRGSVNRSFRAPSLPQVHYSNYVNIAFDIDGGSIVTPFLPLRDQLVQEAFNIGDLKPETSFDVALGLTSKVNENLLLTLDVYQITIEDRIAISGGIPAEEFSQFDGAGYNELNIFTNAIDTKTQGLDFVANYNKRFDKSSLGLSLGVNFNKTEVDGTHQPDVFTQKGIDIVDKRNTIFLTEATPKRKVIFSANYRFGHLGLLARLTNFGEVSDPTAPSEINTEDGFQVFQAKTLTDLAATWNFTDKLSMSFGVNNLFDVYPDMLEGIQLSGEVIYSRRVNQFGSQGRFVNMSINYSW